MGGDGHDGPRPISHQHVVADPDGYLFLSCGVDAIAPGEHPQLFRVLSGPIQLVLGGDFGNEGPDGPFVRPPGNQFVDQGVFGGQNHVSGAEDGVGAGGEHRELLIKALDGEQDLRTLAAADPVGLHDLNLLGPPIQLVEVVQQPVRVLGDPEEPLFQLSLLNSGAAPLAGIIDHLLVGQHRVAGWAPIDRGGLLVGEAIVVQLQKQPLGPAVVIGQARGYFPPPVIAQTHPLQLAAHVLYVMARPLAGVDIPLDGRVFRGQTEGIPPHRMEDVVAPHGVKSGDYIANGIIAHMAHVQAARWIWEHLEAVVLGLAGIFFDLIKAVLFPVSLPFVLDNPKVIMIHLIRPFPSARFPY